VAFSTATKRISTAFVRLSESFRIVWLSRGFDRPTSRDAVDCFLTNPEHVVDEVFDRLVEQAAHRGLLDVLYYIDSTDVRAMSADQDASKCCNPTKVS